MPGIRRSETIVSIAFIGAFASSSSAFAKLIVLRPADRRRLSNDPRTSPLSSTIPTSGGDSGASNAISVVQKALGEHRHHVKVGRPALLDNYIVVLPAPFPWWGPSQVDRLPAAHYFDEGPIHLLDMATRRRE